MRETGLVYGLVIQFDVAEPVGGFDVVWAMRSGQHAERME